MTSALETFQLLFPWKQLAALMLSKASPPSPPPCLEGLARASALPLRAPLLIWRSAELLPAALLTSAEP